MQGIWSGPASRPAPPLLPPLSYPANGVSEMIIRNFRSCRPWVPLARDDRL